MWLQVFENVDLFVVECECVMWCQLRSCNDSVIREREGRWEGCEQRFLIECSYCLTVFSRSSKIRACKSTFEEEAGSRRRDICYNPKNCKGKDIPVLHRKICFEWMSPIFWTILGCYSEVWYWSKLKTLHSWCYLEVFFPSPLTNWSRIYK